MEKTESPIPLWAWEEPPPCPAAPCSYRKGGCKDAAHRFVTDDDDRYYYGVGKKGAESPPWRAWAARTVSKRHPLGDAMHCDEAVF